MLFIGGVRDGEWHDVLEPFSDYMVPVPSKDVYKPCDERDLTEFHLEAQRYLLTCGMNDPATWYYRHDAMSIVESVRLLIERHAGPVERETIQFARAAVSDINSIMLDWTGMKKRDVLRLLDSVMDVLKKVVERGVRVGAEEAVAAARLRKENEHARDTRPMR
jgi:hypothetical protein